uniref:Uncharacterized protein n=1 Tax=Siphoviridae sp. ct0uL16 TaxID=2825299 RepID=A0A8S5Q4K3_9CAUD|nr:MAG TPA: hypothetical protein [Siphoviridae sp. ct0uL16]
MSCGLAFRVCFGRLAVRLFFAPLSWNIYIITHTVRKVKVFLKVF